MKATKEDAIKRIQESEDGEWFIRTSKEEESFKSNLIENEVEANIGARIKETYDNIDKDITKVLGTIKPKEIKTFDYIPQILSDLKSKADKVAELEEQIASKGKPSEELERLKGELKSVRELYSTEKSQWETEKGNLQAEFNKTRIKEQIGSAMAGLKFKDIPPAALSALKEVEMNRLVAMAELTDNGIVYKNGDKTVLNPNTAAPKTTAEILAERFKDVIDVSTPKKGTGTKPSFQKEGGKITGVDMILPDSVQSRDDLGKYLMEQGLTRGSAEYTAAYAEHSKDLPQPSV